MSQAVYQVLFANSASRELQRLPVKAQGRIIQSLESLQTNPRPAGCKKLVGSPTFGVFVPVIIGLFIIYEVDDIKRIVDINVIRHRSDAYR